MQLVSGTNNLRATTNRFYPTLMSGLLAVFLAFLQRKDVIFPEDTDEKIIVGYSMIIVGYLGTLLSLIWTFTILYYHRIISRKNTVLLELENKLEFHFFAQEWGTKKNNLFRHFTLFSLFEVIIPYAFILIFLALAVLGFDRIKT